MATLEEQVQHLWQKQNYLHQTNSRVGRRDGCISLGAPPKHYRDYLRGEEISSPLSHNNCQKYEIILKVKALIEADLAVALLSPNEYVRTFAQELNKS